MLRYHIANIIFVIIYNVIVIEGLSLRMTTTPIKQKIVVVGATGYIGKYVVKEAVRRGYDTVAVGNTKNGYFHNNSLYNTISLLLSTTWIAIKTRFSKIVIKRVCFKNR